LSKLMFRVQLRLSDRLWRNCQTMRLGSSASTVVLEHVSESDVMLASASNAIIIGFNVRPSQNAIELAEKEEIDIRTYRVIYKAIEDIEAAMKGLLDPEFKEVVIGHATVRATFKVSGIGTIAGCLCHRRQDY
jgi:translation initiation factor IF-2